MAVYSFRGLDTELLTSPPFRFPKILGAFLPESAGRDNFTCIFWNHVQFYSGRKRDQLYIPKLLCSVHGDLMINPLRDRTICPLWAGGGQAGPPAGCLRVWRLHIPLNIQKRDEHSMLINKVCSLVETQRGMATLHSNALQLCLP